jgi:amino acid permease
MRTAAAGRQTDLPLNSDKCIYQNGSYSMLQNLLLLIWGCISELTKDCQDMTNASSTYLGIAIGAVIGGIISWWIYNRQKKTSEKQDFTLTHIKELNERHDRILKRLEESDKRHDSTLNAIMELNKKIEHIIERQDKLHKSIRTSRLSSKDNNNTERVE